MSKHTTPAPTVGAATLLDLWERSHSRPPLQRALQLLSLFFADSSQEALESLPLGLKEDYLLRLREQLFGPFLESVAGCPACEERLEFRFTRLELAGEEIEERPQSVQVVHEDYRLEVRLPTIAVTQAAAGDGRRLFQRCVLAAYRDAESVAAADLPPAVTMAVARHLQTVDPLALIVIKLTCPACGEQWDARLDPGDYLWQEIDGWAQRTLYEVHALAAAYGWRESDILGLSAWRRHYYMEMIGA